LAPKFAHPRVNIQSVQGTHCQIENQYTVGSRIEIIKPAMLIMFFSESKSVVVQISLYGVVEGEEEAGKMKQNKFQENHWSDFHQMCAVGPTADKNLIMQKICFWVRGAPKV